MRILARVQPQSANGNDGEAIMQLTQTYHSLEMRRWRNDDWLAWSLTTAGMLQPARTLASQGRLTEAIEAAESIWIENYGNMHGVDFRCVTKTTTITVNAGAIDEGRFATS